MTFLDIATSSPEPSGTATTQVAAVRGGSSARDIRIGIVAITPLADDEVRIAVEYCGLCGSDAHIWRGDDGYGWVARGRVLGHEVVGVLSEVGSLAAGNGWRVGDRVVPIAQTGCGSCAACRRDFANGCPEKTTLGLSRDGGLASTTIARIDGLVRVPAGLPALTAVLTEPASVATRAVHRRGGVGPQDRVVVSGPGAVGILAALASRDAGAAEVTLLGTAADVASRADLAAHLGLRIVDRLEPDAAPTVWIEASGAQAALDAAAAALPVGGRLVLVALYPAAPLVAVNDLVRKEIDVVTSYSSFRADYELALELLARRPGLGGRAVRTHPLSELVEAFDGIGSGQGIKVAIDPRRA